MVSAYADGFESREALLPFLIPNSSFLIHVQHTPNLPACQPNRAVLDFCGRLCYNLPSE